MNREKFRNYNIPNFIILPKTVHIPPGNYYYTVKKHYRYEEETNKSFLLNLGDDKIDKVNQAFKKINKEMKKFEEEEKAMEKEPSVTGIANSKNSKISKTKMVGQIPISQDNSDESSNSSNEDTNKNRNSHHYSTFYLVSDSDSECLHLI